MRKRSTEVIPHNATAAEEWEWWERQNPEGAKRMRAFLEQWRLERERIYESRMQSVLGTVIKSQTTETNIPVFQGSCQIHPRYGAKRPSRTGCKICQELYELKCKLDAASHVAYSIKE